MQSTDLLAHDAIVVEQVRKFFELRNQCGLFSTEPQSPRPWSGHAFAPRTVLAR